MEATNLEFIPLNPCGGSCGLTGRIFKEDPMKMGIQNVFQVHKDYNDRDMYQQELRLVIESDRNFPRR